MFALRIRTRSAARLAVALVLALVTACGGGGGDDGSPTSPEGDPGIPGAYDLSTVNSNAVPYTTVNSQVGSVHLRGEVTSGTLTINADGTYSSSMRGRLWNNGNLTADRVTTGGGTWTLVGENRIRFVPSSGAAPYEMERYSWNALTHMRRVVEDGVDATWPYLYMRR